MHGCIEVVECLCELLPVFDTEKAWLRFFFVIASVFLLFGVLIGQSIAIGCLSLPDSECNEMNQLLRDKQCTEESVDVIIRNCDQLSQKAEFSLCINDWCRTAAPPQTAS